MKKISLLIIGFIVHFCVYGQTTVNQKLYNLEAFSRAYGIIRYYSPNPYTEKWTDYDWVKICYNMLDRYSDNNNDISVALKKAFSDIAPDVTFTNEPTRGNIAETKEKYYYWEHTGSGMVQISTLVKIMIPEYASYKPFYVTYKEAENNPDTPEKGKIYSYSIADGLYINVPHALPKSRFDKISTENLFKETEEKFKELFEKAQVNGIKQKHQAILESENFRVANEIVRWNIIRHFYPYYEEDNLNWDKQLEVMLNLALNYQDVHKYYWDVRKYINPIKDAHLRLYPNIWASSVIGRYLADYNIPVTLESIEGKVIVTAVASKFKTNMTRGCVITKVNGINIDKLIDFKRQYYNTSTKDFQTNYIVGTLFKCDKRDSLLVVEYLTQDNTINIDSLHASSYESYNKEVQGDFIKVVSDGVYYINPTLYKGASYKNFKKELPKLQSARGIIFDIRGYPVYDFDKILSHFINGKISTPEYSTPVSCFPNREKLSYKTSTEVIEPIDPKISVPVVYLTNANAMSWGETVMMLVKGHNLGTIIGSPTCGTNGDVTNFNLPIFSFPMTGLKVYNTDGTLHHGIGVLPDIEVRPTYRGFLEGKDELLDAAINFLLNKNNISIADTNAVAAPK